MVPVVTPAALQDVRSPADGESYPRDILADCRTALILFAAGFYGRQDGYWIAAAGIAADCVDVDADRLEVMRRIYPDDWTFMTGDVYGFMPHLADGEWDLVSVDCPTGHFDRCAEMIAEFCAKSRRYVVLGTGARTALEAPAGWTLLERRYRSDFKGGVEWAVLERC